MNGYLDQKVGKIKSGKKVGPSKLTRNDGRTEYYKEMNGL